MNITAGNFKAMSTCVVHDLEIDSSFVFNHDSGEGLDVLLYKDRISKTIGKVIRENRLRQGMSGKELADKLQISQQQVSRYERGINQIDLPKFIHLMNILGIRPYYIFEMINKVAIKE